MNDVPPMDDDEPIDPDASALRFFWECFGPTLCMKCGQEFFSDQIRFYRKRSTGRSYARCAHCGAMHRFRLALT